MITPKQFGRLCERTAEEYEKCARKEYPRVAIEIVQTLATEEEFEGISDDDFADVVESAVEEWARLKV